MAHASVNIRHTGSERESSKIRAQMSVGSLLSKVLLFHLFCFVFVWVEPLPGKIYFSERFPVKLYLKVLQTVEKSTSSNWALWNEAEHDVKNYAIDEKAF